MTKSMKWQLFMCDAWFKNMSIRSLKTPWFKNMSIRSLKTLATQRI